MTNLKLMDEEAVPLPEGFSVSEYCAKLFLMVGGKEETVEILCDNAVMNNIIDRFGRTGSNGSRGQCPFQGDCFGYSGQHLLCVDIQLRRQNEAAFTCKRCA